MADRLQVPLLGSLPLSPNLREAGDEGTPLVIADPDNAVSKLLREIAQKIVRSGPSKVGRKLPVSQRIS